MNLSQKYGWIIELLSIMLVFVLINLCVRTIGGKDFNSIVSSQLLNITGSTVLFLFAIYRIKAQITVTNQTLLSFFQRSLSFLDGLLIFALLVIGLFSIVLMSKFKVVELFNFNFFPQKRNFILHLNHSQIMIVNAAIVISNILIVLGEELYFRCYLFNHQYIQFGRVTWIINGFSWCIYHFFSPQNILVLLPQCLLYAYVYQRRRNIWITILAHLISNFMALYPSLKMFNSLIVP